MPRGRRSGSTPAGQLASGNATSGVVASLRAARDELLARQQSIAGQLRAIDQALAAFGVTAGRAVVPPAVAVAGRGRRRGPSPGTIRPGSLKDHIRRVLAGGGVMAVKDIAAAVLRSGFKTKNKTLAKSVGIALAKMPGVVRVGRGKFRAA